MSLAHIIAKNLLDIQAIHLRPQQPFQFTSGLKSPIYCDNRLSISYPKVRQLILDGFLALIAEKSLDVAVVAGTATAGIPQATLIADRKALPLVYVRATAKAHGKGNQIEGKLLPGAQTLVVEDLVSTGQSVLGAVAALRSADMPVTDVAAIFSYAFPDTEAQFAAAGLTLHTLTDFPALLAVALEEGRITADDAALLRAWQLDPAGWATT